MGKKTDTDTINKRHEFGCKLLGPVVAEFLMKLNGYINFFEEVRNAKILFVSRAGIRIKQALNVFVHTTNAKKSQHADYFWISRLMVAKGTWKRHRENAIALFKQEFYHSNIRDFAEAMHRQHGNLPDGFPLGDPALDMTGKNLADFFNANGPAAYSISSYFNEQSAFFDEYLSNLLEGRKSALLVDTGWAGTAQRLLADAYPDIDWWGAYFGRYGFEHTNRKYWRQMLGLVFEQDEYEYERPETCTILHRHMIEDLFEPVGPSVECLVKDPHKGIHAPAAEILLKDSPTKENAPVFAGVLEYLSTLPDGHTPAALHRAARRAWEQIARIVTLPTREETRLFSDVSRSADFGKALQVPLLLPPKNRDENDSPEKRIRDSLWQPGQVALEYPPELAEPIQRRLCGLGMWDFKRPIQKPLPEANTSSRPLVAVITRTLDRPMFLKRALQSVAAQTFDDYVHVVVSDGGDIERTKRTIEETNCQHHKVLLVDNIVNRGMEAASNIAINAVDSKYIVIHDDDDTWEPDFLKKTVAYLEGEKGRLYGGVITKSTYISEEVTPEGIKIHDRRPYQDWVQNVHIMEMAIQNFFPPIAFLFKREIYEKIGGYNEDYPVLGDWDFNLRFLMESDIGVIHEALANYHHRDKGDVMLFGNSVIAGQSKHVEFASVVRNRFARNMPHRDSTSIAILVGLGLHLDSIRQSTRHIEQKTIEIPHTINILAEQSAIMKKENMHDEQASFTADDYWVAITRLKKAIQRQDVEILQNLGIKKVGRIKKMISWFNTPSSNQAPSLTPEEIRYLTQLRKEGYEPEAPPDFDEYVYLQNNKDVAKALRAGNLSSGYEHFYYHGRKEGRGRPKR